MAIKTFTTGEVLTASDTNTYLANAGLVYVASTSAVPAQATVTISNCFSASYDSYRVVVSGVRCTTGARFISAQLRAGGTTSITGYYHARMEASPLSSSQTSNDSAWTWSIVMDSIAGASNYAGGSVDVFNPFNTFETSYVSSGTDPRTTGAFMRSGAGWHDTTTSYTDLVLTVSGDSFNAGLFTVYGYRKA